MLQRPSGRSEAKQARPTVAVYVRGKGESAADELNKAWKCSMWNRKNKDKKIKEDKSEVKVALWLSSRNIRVYV